MEGTLFAASYYTQLAVGLLFPTVQKIFELVREGDFERAYTLFIYFVNLHPPDVREEVLAAVDEEKAEEAARREVEELYGAELETLMRETALRGEAMAEFTQRKCRRLLEQGTRALGEAWTRHGLVWWQLRRGASL